VQETNTVWIASLASSISKPGGQPQR